MDNTGILTDARPIVMLNISVILADDMTKQEYAEYHSVINCATVIKKSAVSKYVIVRCDCSLDATFLLACCCHV